MMNFKEKSIFHFNVLFFAAALIVELAMAWYGPSMQDGRFKWAPKTAAILNTDQGISFSLKEFAPQHFRQINTNVRGHELVF